MKSRKTTRRALLSSIMALILCCAMLVGSTFAWFTDSVSSVNNVIKSGNLDVEVYNGLTTDDTNLEDVQKLFSKVELWEPGVVAYENLTVANVGTLALKYIVNVNFTNENTVDGYGLSQILKVAVVKGGITETDRDALIAGIPAEEWKTMADFALNGELYPAGTEGKDAQTTYGLVIYWEPSADDNNWNVNNGKTTSDGEDYLHIDLGINLVATQLMAEEDSFGSDYDKEATYPAVSVVNVPENTTEPTRITAGDVTVSIPAGAEAGQYKLEVPSKSLNTDAATGVTTVTYDINLYLDGVKAGEADYDVEINVGTMLDVTGVTHNGEAVNPFDYKAMVGVVSFKTTSFSPFAVIYKSIPVSGLEVVDGHIVAGTFEGVNPASLDPALAEENSEYIAVNYMVDGVACYVVSERATTVVLAASDTVYTAENGNYTTTAASGKLYSIISSLQNNDHSTVYILPGTYNEATTINVYSSMDIIGLGDKDTVKIVKTSSSDSNRHLFNCNGTKADYIQVTLRNLYLDATTNTTGGKDNAAVQCIRKTMVKCYDLTVVKATGWSAIAFYVNGNNAVGGVTYPAYLYAENCVLNAANTFNVVSTSGTYKFYHSGLTYNNGSSAYTTNSGSIKNQTMEPNDWVWD